MRLARRREVARELLGLGVQPSESLAPHEQTVRAQLVVFIPLLSREGRKGAGMEDAERRREHLDAPSAIGLARNRNGQPAYSKHAEERELVLDRLAAPFRLLCQTKEMKRAVHAEDVHEVRGRAEEAKRAGIVAPVLKSSLGNRVPALGRRRAVDAEHGRESHHRGLTLTTDD